MKSLINIIFVYINELNLPPVIFEKLSSLVNVSSIEMLTLNKDSTYRYFELLENILDLEESDQVLYKLQVSKLDNIVRYM